MSWSCDGLTSENWPILIHSSGVNSLTSKDISLVFCKSWHVAHDRINNQYSANLLRKILFFPSNEFADARVENKGREALVTGLEMERCCQTIEESDLDCEASH